MAKVLLVGLASETNDRLTRVLEAHEHTVVEAPEPADAVFCGPDVRQAVEAHSDTPVIVVTGRPSAGQFLDAMDFGAANYCSEPLEESEVLWTLAAALDRNE